MFEEIYGKDYLDFYHPSKCIGDLGEKWCTFKWHVYNIHLYPNERLRSPVFTTGMLPNASWHLEADISSPGDIKAIDLSLTCLRNHTVIDINVDIIYKIICEEEIKISEKKTVQFNPLGSWADKKGFSASFNKSRISYLVIECKLRPNKSMICNVSHIDVDETLAIFWRRQLQFGELFDTIIRVKDYRLKAHVAILHARLPQLLVKCLSPCKEDGKHIVNITDLPVSAVKEMLKYAYTGQACLDLESVAVDKNLIISYSRDFWKSCCWDDNPSAKTFFNYETDTFSWNLKDIYEKEHLDCEYIDLLKKFPNQILIVLVVSDSEEDGKWLEITADMQGSDTPPPAIVSCNSFLVNRDSNETVELGETEIHLGPSRKFGNIKLCSLLEVQKSLESFRIKEDSLVLQTDFKICYGSYKSTIENICDDEFNISQCTGCLNLRIDMENLFRSGSYSDVIINATEGNEIYGHRAILLARSRSQQT